MRLELIDMPSTLTSAFAAKYCPVSVRAVLLFQEILGREIPVRSGGCSVHPQVFALQVCVCVHPLVPAHAAPHCPWVQEYVQLPAWTQRFAPPLDCVPE